MRSELGCGRSKKCERTRRTESREQREREREKEKKRRRRKGLTEGAKIFCLTLRYGMCAIKEVGFQFDERAVPAHKAGRAALAEAAAAGAGLSDAMLV